MAFLFLGLDTKPTIIYSNNALQASCPTVIRTQKNVIPNTATVHTHPANSTANPEKINPLSRVEKNKSATNPITCGRVNPDIFKSDDVKSVSSLSQNNKPMWRHNVSGERSKFLATISLYGARSEGILVQRSLGY